MLAGKLSSRRAYTGKVISLDVDQVRFPDGSTGELEMIRHPGASAIVPVLSDLRESDPELVLLRQYRYAAEEFLYEIPAGRLEANEEPAACARRELQEETGFVATDVDHLYTMFTTPGFTDERIHLFVARGLERGEAAREADEFITLEIVRLSSALELIRTGKLKDGKTAVALLFLAAFLSRS